MTHIDYEEESAKRGNWLDITGGAAKDSLTVLDYFAGKAMVGLITKSPLTLVDADEESEWFSVVARGAYDYAEAMLAERNKRFTPQNVVKGVTGKTYG